MTTEPARGGAKSAARHPSQTPLGSGSRSDTFRPPWPPWQACRREGHRRRPPRGLLPSAWMPNARRECRAVMDAATRPAAAQLWLGIRPPHRCQRQSCPSGCRLRPVRSDSGRRPPAPSEMAAQPRLPPPAGRPTAWRLLPRTPAPTWAHTASCPPGCPTAALRARAPV